MKNAKEELIENVLKSKHELIDIQAIVIQYGVVYCDKVKCFKFLYGEDINAFL